MYFADEPKTKFTVEHDKSPGRAISKYDLGEFLVDCLSDETRSCKVVGLAKVNPAA